jgi:hypothetical protein
VSIRGGRRDAGELAPTTGSVATGLVRRAGPPSAHVPPPATTFIKPRWLGLHLLAWSLTAAMVLLGRWQLTVSNEKHFNLQNFGYAMQWWAFSATVLFFWLKLIRDARRPPAAAGDQAPLALLPGQPAQAVAPTYSGPADLISRTDRADRTPTAYRGYVIANSAISPARSEDDGYHGAYNDHLWALNLADTAKRGDPGRAQDNESNTDPIPPAIIAPEAVEGDIHNDL